MPHIIGRERGKNINFNLTKKTTQIMMMKENLGMIVSYIVCNNFFKEERG